ncbi:Nuclear autoantigenic sperm protein [Zancudomyces culisetae]|uniref:Nuclear autoantigenic sperm protein n=1 Tax=Zancudomyces culisetae TaxID=1213189 RepID=A0A1R1PGH0_ZANCU|nr:Nuclear autoantigenic sperm protein [Zancudomyces culisetae]|eukprot:OMH80029.1 Nuclear autoantigenic sperm protein [Zancudomyces culisetae]
MQESKPEILNVDPGKQRAKDEIPTSIGELTEDQKAILPVIQKDIELGTRAFALKQYELAIDHFSHLSELTEQSFGSDSQRYADSLILYGRALLQNAIAQNEIMAQQALSGENDGKEENSEAISNPNLHFNAEPDFQSLEQSGTEDEQGKKELSEFEEFNSFVFKVGSSSKSAASGQDQHVATTSSSSGAAFTKAYNETLLNNGDARALKESEGEKEEESGEEGEREEEGEEEEEGEGEDESLDFQTAWQVLDLARVIQSKDETPKGQLKMAETLLLLGEVSMESGNFSQAAQDFKTSLAVKEKHLSPDDRQLAEVSFNLALSLEYNQQKSDALKQLEKVKDILKLRIANLEQKNDPELDSVKPLLAEIEEKANDLSQELAQETKDSKQGPLSDLQKELHDSTVKFISETVNTENINDLTSLVRSKKSNKTGVVASSSSIPSTAAVNGNLKPTGVSDGERSSDSKRKIEAEDEQTHNNATDKSSHQENQTKRPRVEDIYE